MSDIIYEKSERVATITLNRPERLNAWRPSMGDEVRKAMLDADADPEIGAIVITGAGRAFCAGADMAVLNNIADGAERATHYGDEAVLQSRRPDFRGQFSYLLGLRKPVIGAINGACVGMGFTSSLYFDVRLAAEEARMGLIFVRRGLAIEHGASWMLPRLVGLGKAMELAITGRLVDAHEALAMGLVNRVVPAAELMTVAREMARDIAAGCSPRGVAEAKRSIYEHLFCDLAQGMAEDDELTGRMLAGEDFKEGIRAFQEKRAPRFTGR